MNYKKQILMRLLQLDMTQMDAIHIINQRWGENLCKSYFSNILCGKEEGPTPNRIKQELEIMLSERERVLLPGKGGCADA